MPVYDYECLSCGRKFEELVASSRIDDVEIECPFCGEKNARKRLSAPAIGSIGGNSPTDSCPSKHTCSSGFS